jgi:fatty acid desaturase
LHRLRRDLEARGLTRKRPLAVVLQLIGAVAVTAAGCLLTWLPLPWPVRVLGMLVSVLGMITVGTNSHTSSHRATSDRLWVNQALTFFGYPVFLGLAATSWWQRHVVVHHPAPNVVGVDGDSNLWPWFAMTRDEIDRATGWRRFYFRHVQFWAFPLVLLGNSFNMQVSGWRYVVSCLRDPKRRSWLHVIDLASLCAHYVLWFALPLLFFGWKVLVVSYVVRMLLMSYAMYAVLAPGHYPADALRFSGDHRKADFLLLQAACSMNFRGGWLASWTCSGLQYQVEHHLFPALTHVNYPKVAPMVKELCRTHGLPYNEMGWAHVLWKSWAVLRNPPRTVQSLETARVA